MMQRHRRTAKEPLAGLRALITGGSSGVGAATARAFAAHGVQLAIAGRDVTALQGVAEATHAWIIPGDLRTPGCPRHTVELALEALGGLDLVVSNAGIGWAGPFGAMSDAEIDAVIDTNLRAAAHLVHAAIPHLRRDVGRIVFVGSIAGLVEVPGEAMYSMTKAGLGYLADALREELRPEGIGVSLVSPGVVDTAFFERRHAPYQRSFPQLLSAETVAGAIVDVVSRHRDDAVVPLWLNVPAKIKMNFPHVYRALSSRFAAYAPTEARWGDVAK